MTASGIAKTAGIKSLAEVSRLTGVSAQTLNNWFNNKPDLFNVVVIGCSIMGKIKINYPNDYGSDLDYQSAIEQCGNEENIIEELAIAAKSAGLKFVCSTDYGAEWMGTFEQIEVCMKILPDWAKNYTSLIE